MSRYTDSVCRLCRHEGKKLFLKGDRCNTGKCAIVRRAYRPGQHGQKRHKLSEYGIRLKEKQKMRRVYGVIEGQFRRYYDVASSKKGVTGEEMMRLLELRLDNVLYRLGFATSRAQARQIVGHGHVLINGHRVDIPSYRVRLQDTINIAGQSVPYVRRLVEAKDMALPVPNWLACDVNTLSGQVLSLPSREEIDTSIQENLVIEYYAR